MQTESYPSPWYSYAGMFRILSVFIGAPCFWDAPIGRQIIFACFYKPKIKGGRPKGARKNGKKIPPGREKVGNLDSEPRNMVLSYKEK